MREHLDAMIRDALAPYTDRIAALEREVEDLHRRARNQGRRGVVAAVDHNRGMCRVKHGGNTTPWIRWASPAAGDVNEWRPPSVGEGCELVSHAAGDDGAQVVAIPGITTAAYPPAGASATLHRVAYKDGSSVDYDYAAHVYKWTNGQTSIIHDRAGLTLSSNGSSLRIDAEGITLNGQKINLTAANSIALNGQSVAVTSPTIGLNGATAVQGGMSIAGGEGMTSEGSITTDGDVVAAGVSVTKHTHKEQGDGASTSPPE